MNIGLLEHLSFERSHDGGEIVAAIHLHGAATKGLLTRHRAVLALASLLESLGLPPHPQMPTQIQGGEH